jgi:hypothetical protein
VTFREALTRVKDQHLPDESTERVGDARMVQSLNEASSEIASAFGLGRYPYLLSLTDTTNGTLTLTDAQAQGAYALEEVAVGGLMVRRVDGDRAELYRHVSGPPRYYVWERLTPRSLVFFPAPARTTSVRVIVHKEMPLASYDANAGGASTTPIWFGAYAPWHDLVVLKAVAKILDAQRLFEEAGQYMQRYQGREQEFAAHMQGLSKDVAMAMAARA